jgi:4-amino-4-deoxy-L-arabinose transferase-like glycosyltransferase
LLQTAPNDFWYLHRRLLSAHMPTKIFQAQHTPFWIFSFSLLIGLTLPTLIQEGMFMDAMLYTSVSHNLSMGIGTFWFPQFSVHNVGGLDSFHEQPPLVFGIQALFFKLLGHSMYVERIYTFLTMCITALFIVVLWKNIQRSDSQTEKMGWLPLILWITIPVCFWSYSNNMHENTMGIFTLASVLLSYKAVREKSGRPALLLASGLFIVLASLSKGFPGFFPLAVPLLYAIITRESSITVAVKQTIILLAVPVVAYLILFTIPESRESLSTYLFKRALHRISEVPTVDTRFYIIGRLIMELTLQLSAVCLVLVIARIRKLSLSSSPKVREGLFFIAVGLAGTAPLMLTLVQKGFYFVPALPFLAIGLACLIAPLIPGVVSKTNTGQNRHRIFVWVSSLLLVASITLTAIQKGKVSRNHEMIHDVFTIGATLPKFSIVSVPEEMWLDFNLQCYLIRYCNISVEAGYNRDYLINDKNMNIATPAEFKKVDISTMQYHLYKRD